MVCSEEYELTRYQAIHPARVLHKEEYRAFCLQVLAAMRRILGENVVNPSVIPDIKHFL